MVGMVRKAALGKMLILLIGREEGFSLLEILIVIVLMAALIGVNLPNFEGLLNSIESRGQLLKVEHFFKAIRENSISQQRRIELTIKNNQFFCQINNQEKLNLDIEIINSSVDRISYYPDGTSSGGSFSIYLSDKSIYSAFIDQITGKIKWEN